MKPTQHSISVIAIAACGIFIGISMPARLSMPEKLASGCHKASFLDPR